MVLPNTIKSDPMSSPLHPDAGFRDRIIADPAVVLDDADIMRALVTAHSKAMGDNVVDLRGIAMERLEARLGQLTDTHRAVVAAAYDNLSGTHQIHRAVLRLLEADRPEDFLHDLGTSVAEILRVESIRLVIEAAPSAEDHPLAQTDGVLLITTPGFVDRYISGDRSPPLRQVTLRQVGAGTSPVHPARDIPIRSEACLRLDPGEGRLPAMAVLGSADLYQFTPQQGTDLLSFFAAVLERALRRWLA